MNKKDEPVPNKPYLTLSKDEVRRKLSEAHRVRAFYRSFIRADCQDLQRRLTDFKRHYPEHLLQVDEWLLELNEVAMACNRQRLDQLRGYYRCLAHLTGYERHGGDPHL